MTIGAPRHSPLLPLMAIVATFAGAGLARAQTTDGPVLSISEGAWTAFVAHVRGSAAAYRAHPVRR